MNPCRIIPGATTQYVRCDDALTGLSFRPQGHRGRPQPAASQPASRLRTTGDMEEGDAEGEGPVAVREGPSGQGHALNAASNSSSSTTTTLLASVKEQVGGCCSHALVPLTCVSSPLTWTLHWCCCLTHRGVCVRVCARVMLCSPDDLL